VSYRPNALLTTPDGRLWMGSSPDYGLRNGTLAWYEPKTGAKKSHRTIVPDTSPAAMLWLPDQQQILIGLSIEAGTGVSVSRLNGAFCALGSGEG
jgi:sugar lactone lactonase YvrE